MHYYQHHIGDFIKDTSFLSNEEIGIYSKLIWIYYDTEQPLPNELTSLAMKTNARDSEQTVLAILKMFFTLDDSDVWVHTRCEKVIADYHKQLETASKAGKASAEKRKKSSQAQQDLNDRSTTVQPTINHKPITINHKPFDDDDYPIGGELLSEKCEWLVLETKGQPYTATNLLIKRLADSLTIQPITVKAFLTDLFAAESMKPVQARVSEGKAEQWIASCCRRHFLNAAK